jgi:hypothetical protein
MPYAYVLLKLCVRLPLGNNDFKGSISSRLADFLSHKDRHMTERIFNTGYAEPDHFKHFTRLDIPYLVDLQSDGAALPPLEVTSLWTNSGMDRDKPGSGIREAQQGESDVSCNKCQSSEIVGTICHTFCGDCRKDPDTNDEEW